MFIPVVIPIGLPDGVQAGIATSYITWSRQSLAEILFFYFTEYLFKFVSRLSTEHPYSGLPEIGQTLEQWGCRKMPADV